MNLQIFRRFYSTPIGNFHVSHMHQIIIKKNKNNNKDSELNKEKKISSYAYMYQALIDRSKMIKP